MEPLPTEAQVGVGQWLPVHQGQGHIMYTLHVTRKNSSWCPLCHGRPSKVCASRLVNKNPGRVDPYDPPYGPQSGDPSIARQQGLEKGNVALCRQLVCMNKSHPDSGTIPTAQAINSTGVSRSLGHAARGTRKAVFSMGGTSMN